MAGEYDSALDCFRGVKGDEKVTKDFAPEHVAFGIAALKLIKNDGRTVRHLKYDY